MHLRTRPACWPRRPGRRGRLARAGRQPSRVAGQRARSCGQRGLAVGQLRHALGELGRAVGDLHRPAVHRRRAVRQLLAARRDLTEALGQRLGPVVELRGPGGELLGPVGQLRGTGGGLLVALGEGVETVVHLAQVALRHLLAQRIGRRRRDLLADVGHGRARRRVADQPQLALDRGVRAGREHGLGEVGRDGQHRVVRAVRQAGVGVVTVGQHPQEVVAGVAGVGQCRGQRPAGGHRLRVGDDRVVVDDRDRHLVDVRLAARRRPDQQRRGHHWQQHAEDEDPAPRQPPDVRCGLVFGLFTHGASSRR